MNPDLIKSLREAPNPFDFSNPVSDERSFYGRSTETADVVYYLKHAKSTDKPIHLALVGSRASGKTSFLNMAEIEAKRRDFCTVRINLNEGDVKTDLGFFRKFVDSVIMQSFQFGAFGGKSSPFCIEYLNLMATGSVSNHDYCQFLSATLIHGAVRAGNTQLNVPDDLIFSDLELIRKEVGRPFLILVDECNVLKLNRIILEKVRNIFMNLSGFMLMFAATDDFFPVMDEVFSPIMRQFKKIEIGPFKGEGDVKQCIRGPLERILPSERYARELAPDAFILEVGRLSGRKPYEIQLICHELFRRCQEGKSKRFSINLPTLESIQQTLAKNQNIGDRPILLTANRMKINLVNVLESLCGGTEHLSIEENWRIEYLFNGNRWSLEDYKSLAIELEDLGFIEIKEHRVRFKGDDFERIYLKYLARSRNAVLNLADFPVDDYLFQRFGVVSGQFEGFMPVVGTIVDPPEDISPVISYFNNSSESAEFKVSALVENVIVNLMYQDPGSIVRLFELRMRSNICNMQVWFMWQEPEHVAGLKKLKRRFDEFVKNGSEVDIEIEVFHFDIKVLDSEEIYLRVNSLNDEQLAVRVANELMDMVHFAYVRQRDKRRALNAAKAAYKLQQSRLHTEANNVGYLYIDNGDLDEALLWLEAAKQYYDIERMLICHYNLGVLHALRGDLSVARSEFDAALRIESDHSAACLHKLCVDDSGNLTSIEVSEVDAIKPLAEEGIKVIGIVERVCRI